MYYRYEYDYTIGTLNPHLGIITGWEFLEPAKDDDEFWDRMKHVAFFEDHLPGPDCDMTNTESWFTQKGNRKFHKAIKELVDSIVDRGNFKVIRLSAEELDESRILYRDPYQVILRKEEMVYP